MKDTDTTLEVAVLLRVTGGHPSSPGRFNPRDGGTPPEPAEVEFRVLLEKEGREPLDITDYLDTDTLEDLERDLIDQMESDAP